MPSLGTLVTVVTADTSGFTAGMNTAAQEAQKFSAKVDDHKSALSGWGKELETVGHKFTTLGGLFKIGFGVGTAKAVLSELHHALINFGEGFAAAQKAGEGFWESIADGARSIVGLQTDFQKVAEDAKNLATPVKEIADAMERLRKIQAGESDKQFPLAPREQGAVDAARKAFDDAVKAAEPYHEALEKARAAEQQFFRMGGFVGPKQESIFTIERKEAEQRGRKFFGAEGAAQTTLAEAEAMAGPAQRQAANEKAAEESSKAWDEYYKKLGDEERGIKKFEEERIKAREKAAEELRKDLEETSRTQRKLLEQMDRFDKLKPETTEKLKAVASIGGLADLHNQLQAAALGGDDELPKINAEQKKQTQHLQGLNEKLKALDDRATPLIWA